MSEHNDSGGRNEPQSWEKGVVERIAMEGFKEQRRTRRWGVFFKLLVAVYILALVLLPKGYLWFNDSDPESRPEHVAVVEISGQIADGGSASADEINSLLRSAFGAKTAKAVILEVNSPGGSPVQSGMIYDEINRLREKHPEKPLYAVGTDIMASGAYYIAAAADRIYADQASMVGSIGVIMQSFGFSDLIKEWGIERRVYTAGENKAFMDPFNPERDESVEHIDTMLEDIHTQFKDAVIAGRGDRINIDDEELFSGLMWTGAQSLEKGLVDELASPYQVATEEVGLDKLITYHAGPNFKIIDYLMGTFAGALVEAAQEAGVEQDRLRPSLSVPE